MLDIEVRPSARVQGITGFNTWRSRLSVSVGAQAKHGKANLAVIHVLAKLLDVSTSDLSITNGLRSTLKSVRIERLSVEEVLARLEPLLEVDV